MIQPATAGTSHIAFSDVQMAFGDRVVFESLSCSFPRGKISVILGGSGSGKSTVLRLIGGLVHPQAGRITVAGEDITTLSERRMYQVRKKLGMLFQGAALLDSFTVFDNLAFPLREHSAMAEAEVVAVVHDRIQAVGLSDIDALLPGQLSGGMAKRVALARAIMMKPVILLCDEPFSGLDPISTRLIETLLVDINRRFDMTIIVVSHHIPSTMRIASRALLLLQGGAVEGAPQELLRSGDPRITTFLSEQMHESFELDKAAAKALPESTQRSNHGHRHS